MSEKFNFYDIYGYLLRRLLLLGLCWLPFGSGRTKVGQAKKCQKLFSCSLLAILLVSCCSPMRSSPYRRKFAMLKAYSAVRPAFCSTTTQNSTRASRPFCQMKLEKHSVWKYWGQVNKRRRTETW